VYKQLLQISAVEAGHKVVLPGVDGAFSCSVLVHVWCDQLVLYLVLLIELFQCSGCFIVEKVVFGPDP
jgi:hypothetical protein